jgi:gamma-glutamyl hercynylcysteine S-oxide synthase
VGKSSEQLKQDLADARAQTDRIFQMLAPAAMYERPIPERHRLIFYLGHLEAFDWNLLRAASGGLASFEPEFDRLLGFGIDPIDGKLPDDRNTDWPPIPAIKSYNLRVRDAVDEVLRRNPALDGGLVYPLIIEHRLMHAETLTYMIHWLPYDLKVQTTVSVSSEEPPPGPRQIPIPEGWATLGMNKKNPSCFGWDNEFDPHSVFVPAFSIDAFDVTNQQFLEFVKAGGYSDRSFWHEDSWRWIQSSGITHPKFWVRGNDRWFYRTMFQDVPLPLAWPVYVSQAEATAYARWAGKALPTEAQYHRAAFGSPDDPEGADLPLAQYGNFGARAWTPAPVGAFPAGRSAFGVFDLVGNGWEWTSTPFGPFKGFRPYPLYPGYSADFFDGKHFVLKGASPRTPAPLVRTSFRNWFQPHYPNIYATFRCVEN